jgi:hypothetical protein
VLARRSDLHIEVVPSQADWLATWLEKAGDVQAEIIVTGYSIERDVAGYKVGRVEAPAPMVQAPDEDEGLAAALATLPTTWSPPPTDAALEPTRRANRHRPNCGCGLCQRMSRPRRDSSEAQP